MVESMSTKMKNTATSFFCHKIYHINSSYLIFYFVYVVCEQAGRQAAACHLSLACFVCLCRLLNPIASFSVLLVVFSASLWNKTFRYFSYNFETSNKNVKRPKYQAARFGSVLLTTHSLPSWSNPIQMFFFLFLEYHTHIAHTRTYRQIRPIELNACVCAVLNLYKKYARKRDEKWT